MKNSNKLKPQISEFDENVFRQRLNEDLEDFLVDESLELLFEERKPGILYANRISTRHKDFWYCVPICIFLVLGALCWNMIPKKSDRDVVVNDILALNVTALNEETNTKSENEPNLLSRVAGDEWEKFLDPRFMNDYSNEKMTLVQSKIEDIFAFDFPVETKTIDSDTIVTRVQRLFKKEYSEEGEEEANTELTEQEEQMIRYVSMCSNNSVLSMEPFICALGVLLTKP